MLRLDFILFRFHLLCVLHVSLNHFVLALRAFVVLGLVSSERSQETGWEWQERLRNDLFVSSGT